MSTGETTTLNISTLPEEPRYLLVKVYVPCCLMEHSGLNCQCAKNFETFPGLYQIKLRGQDERVSEKDWVSWIRDSLAKVDDSLLCLNGDACSCSLHQINAITRDESNLATRQSVPELDLLEREQHPLSPPPTPPEIPERTFETQHDPSPPIRSADQTSPESSENATIRVSISEEVSMLSKRLECVLSCQGDIIRCQDRQAQLIAEMAPMINQPELWTRVHAMSSAIYSIQQYLATWGADQFTDSRWC
jgi:hypothetical protein